MDCEARAAEGSWKKPINFLDKKKTYGLFEELLQFQRGMEWYREAKEMVHLGCDGVAIQYEDEGAKACGIMVRKVFGF